MKIRIAYLPEEEAQAAAVLAALRPLLPGVHEHKSEGNPPFSCAILTTKKRWRRCKNKRIDKSPEK